MRRLYYVLILFAVLVLSRSQTVHAQPVTPPVGAAALVCAYNTAIPAPSNGAFAYVQCDSTGKLITTSTGGSGTPGGTPGQIQFNSAGAFGGFTMSGDCTTVTSTGVITCTAIGGKAVTLSGPLTTTGPSATTTFALGATGDTYTFPDASDTVVLLTATQSLTNKTFVGPVLGAATGTSLRLNGASLSTNEISALNYSPGANTNTPGLGVVNANVAASGLQQSSCLILSGQGWKTTATAASQEVDALFCVNPVQGAATPAGGFEIWNQINGAGFTRVMDFNGTTAAQLNIAPSVTLGANLTVPSGNVSSGGNLIGSAAASQVTAAVFTSTGTKPTSVFAGGTCAGGTLVGGAVAGTATLTGACAATNTWTLSVMPTVTNGYACTANDRTTPAAILQETSTSTTTAVFTFSGTTGATDVIQYHCIGY